MTNRILANGYEEKYTTVVCFRALPNQVLFEGYDRYARDGVITLRGFQPSDVLLMCPMQETKGELILVKPEDHFAVYSQTVPDADTYWYIMHSGTKSIMLFQPFEGGYLLACVYRAPGSGIELLELQWQMRRVVKER